MGCVHGISVPFDERHDINGKGVCWKMDRPRMEIQVSPLTLAYGPNPWDRRFFNDNTKPRDEKGVHSELMGVMLV